ncbi:MAG: metalloregulator ArsR/SmtB family transcription factor [Betaproteobacteria bacterium]|nr:metalloregulator ArsR/SmtB family transcription factor [Betaproteobacteria bacterium]
METLAAAELLAALGHESRLSIFRLLVEAGDDGLFANVIDEQLDMAPATLSFHLAHLNRVGLIKGQKEGRFIRYSADYGEIDELVAFLTQNCCQGGNCLPKTEASNTMAKRRASLQKTSSRREGIMSDRIYNVLFLCTGNSARSILAESILNHISGGRFRAFSAGSRPTGVVNQHVLDFLNEHGLPTEQLRSKSWDEFAQNGAPTMDFVFTVCSSAAGETCPVWPGQPMTAHWGIEDPAAVEGDEQTKRHAVSVAFHLLNRRIELFRNLPLSKIARLSLQQQLDEIGQLPQQED